MLKTLLRFLVVTALAVALGVLIYHLNQPSAASSFAGGFGRDGGFGEHGFGERGFSLVRGLSGVAGDLFLVAAVTVIVVTARKALSFATRPVRTPR